MKFKPTTSPIFTWDVVYQEFWTPEINERNWYLEVDCLFWMEIKNPVIRDIIKHRIDQMKQLFINDPLFNNIIFQKLIRSWPAQGWLDEMITSEDLLDWQFWKDCFEYMSKIAFVWDRYNSEPAMEALINLPEWKIESGKFFLNNILHLDTEEKVRKALENWFIDLSDWWKMSKNGTVLVPIANNKQYEILKSADVSDFRNILINWRQWLKSVQVERIWKKEVLYPWDFLVSEVYIWLGIYFANLDFELVNLKTGEICDVRHTRAVNLHAWRTTGRMVKIEIYNTWDEPVKLEDLAIQVRFYSAKEEIYNKIGHYFLEDREKVKTWIQIEDIFNLKDPELFESLFQYVDSDMNEEWSIWYLLDRRKLIEISNYPSEQWQNMNTRLSADRLTEWTSDKIMWPDNFLTWNPFSKLLTDLHDVWWYEMNGKIAILDHLPDKQTLNYLAFQQGFWNFFIRYWKNQNNYNPEKKDSKNWSKYFWETYKDAQALSRNWHKFYTLFAWKDWKKTVHFFNWKKWIEVWE